MQETVLVPVPTLPWWKRWWGITLILGSIFVLIFGTWFGYLVYSYVKQIKSGELKPLSNYDTSFTAGGGKGGSDNSANAQLIRAYNPTYGDIQAKHTIVEFGDFECPFTGQEFVAIRPIMSIVLGVKFVYRNFPLTQIHEHALDAAIAANCAGAQGKFWEYHDQLFLNQKELSGDALKKYAGIVGLDEKAFESCLVDPATKKQVMQDAQDGYELGVRGTPTFFIDGIKVEGAIPGTAWKQIFDRLNVRMTE